jgi:hypothetical protein
VKELPHIRWIYLGIGDRGESGADLICSKSVRKEQPERLHLKNFRDPLHCLERCSVLPPLEASDVLVI